MAAGHNSSYLRLGQMAWFGRFMVIWLDDWMSIFQIARPKVRISAQEASITFIRICMGFEHLSLQRLGLLANHVAIITDFPLEHDPSENKNLTNCFGDVGWAKEGYTFAKKHVLESGRSP